jgi:hypothetical protein
MSILNWIWSQIIGAVKAEEPSGRFLAGFWIFAVLVFILGYWIGHPG